MIPTQNHKYRTKDGEVIVILKIDNDFKRIHYKYLDNNSSSETPDSCPFWSFSDWESGGYEDLSGTVTVGVNDPALGETTGEGIYDLGKDVTIEAKAFDGNQFCKWDDGNLDNPRTINVTGDLKFIALFKEKPEFPEFEIVVKSDYDNKGTTKGSGKYTKGAEVKISASSKDGFVFTHWDDGNKDNPRIIVVSKNAEYIAIFDPLPPPPPQCTITVNVNDPTMGIVSGGGVYYKGTEVTFSAKANKGCVFEKWNDGYDSNPRQVTVEKDALYTAIFKNEEPEPVNPKFTISVKPNDGSMGATSGGGEYVLETKVEISAIANDGFVFEHWGDGNKENPRVITVEEDAEYIAYFRKKQNKYKVTVVSDDNIMGSVTGGGTFDAGSEVEIKAIPNKGFCFVSWDDDNRDNPRTITVNSDVSFTAKFGKDVVSHHAEQEQRDKEAAYQRERLNRLIESIRWPKFATQNVNTQVLADISDKYDLLRERGSEQRNEKGKKEKGRWWERITWWRKTKGGLGWFTELLWWVAGVDKNLLATIKAEHNRYVGMGSVILFTAFMAAFSCSYALYYVFNKLGIWWVSLPIGIIWGIGILFIDRFISSTLNGDTFWQRIGKHGGWVRILISFILGIVISAPLSMTLFDDEINNVIEKNKIDEISKRQTESEAKIDALYSSQKSELSDEVTNAKKKVEDTYRQYTNSRDEYVRSIKEKDRQISNMGTPTRQKIGEKKTTDSVTNTSSSVDLFDENGYQKQLDNQSNKITNLNNSTKQIAEIVKSDSVFWKKAVERDSLNEKQLKALDSIILSKKTEANSQIESNMSELYYDGLGNRLKVFHGFIFGKYGLSLPIILIMLLFIIIDISPVLYKCLLAKGIYEALVEEEQKKKSPKSNNTNTVQNKNDAIVTYILEQCNHVFTTAVDNWHNRVMDALNEFSSEEINETINDNNT